jgi:DNA polymerase I-like protein with 3'-5' exonuclease and polymerase domains
MAVYAQNEDLINIGAYVKGSNPKLDIHRDMAMECYRLGADEWTKTTRSFAKNQYVFPTLYGSYYVSCARNLWSQIGRGKLTTAAGLGIYQHLERKGIGDQKQFEAHIKRVEEKFNARFPTWSREKIRWWEQYLERGWFPLSTGFVCKGIYSYNNLMNTPIQGPSFHLLLWSLIQLNRWTKEKNRKTRVICEIHDSIIADVHREELEEYVEKATQVMTVDVRKHWDWILTPLAVEIEVAEKNWFEKIPYTSGKV